MMLYGVRIYLLHLAVRRINSDLLYIIGTFLFMTS